MEQAAGFAIGSLPLATFALITEVTVIASAV